MGMASVILLEPFRQEIDNALRVRCRMKLDIITLECFGKNHGHPVWLRWSDRRYLDSMLLSFISFLMPTGLKQEPFNGMWQSANKAKTIFHRNNHRSWMSLLLMSYLIATCSKVSRSQQSSAKAIFTVLRPKPWYVVSNHEAVRTPTKIGLLSAVLTLMIARDAIVIMALMTVCLSYAWQYWNMKRPMFRLCRSS